MRIDVQILSFKPMLGYGTTELRCVQPADYLREAGWKVSLGRIGDKVPVPAEHCGSVGQEVEQERRGIGLGMRQDPPHEFPRRPQVSRVAKSGRGTIFGIDR